MRRFLRNAAVALSLGALLFSVEPRQTNVQEIKADTIFIAEPTRVSYLEAFTDVSLRAGYIEELYNQDLGLRRVPMTFLYDHNGQRYRQDVMNFLAHQLTTLPSDIPASIATLPQEMYDSLAAQADTFLANQRPRFGATMFPPFHPIPITYINTPLFDSNIISNVTGQFWNENELGTLGDALARYTVFHEVAHVDVAINGIGVESFEKTPDELNRLPFNISTRAQESAVYGMTIERMRKYGEESLVSRLSQFLFAKYLLDVRFNEQSAPHVPSIPEGNAGRIYLDIISYEEYLLEKHSFAGQIYDEFLRDLSSGNE